MPIIIESATIKAFADVRAAMSSRFASATTETPVEESTVAATASDTTGAATASNTTYNLYRIHRTVFSFRPEPLLCKRLGLKKAKDVLPVAAADKRIRDGAYFEDEILDVAKNQIGDLKAKEANEHIFQEGEEPENIAPLFFELPAGHLIDIGVYAPSTDDECKIEEVVVMKNFILDDFAEGYSFAKETADKHDFDLFDVSRDNERALIRAAAENLLVFANETDPKLEVPSRVCKYDAEGAIHYCIGHDEKDLLKIDYADS